MPLAVCWVSKAGSLSSRRWNMAVRNCSTARLPVQARPYCATKPVRLRSANSPMMASGTSHSGMLPPAKPWSSSLPSSQGMAGSVTAPMAAARPAPMRPARLLRR